MSQVTQGHQKQGAGGMSPPPIISICISKTHKVTRKVQKQFKFNLESPHDNVHPV